jgi:hypothetical protein
VRPLAWHVNTRYVLEVDSAFLVLLFGVSVVVVDMLCTLVVAIFVDHVEC